MNLAHAFVRNLMGGKSNIKYRMVLTKVFKKVKIDLKSKAPGKYKGDFNKNSLKRMKLPLVPPSDEFVVMGEAVEEQLEIKMSTEFGDISEDDEIDTIVRKMCEEELKKENSEKKWKSMKERLVELKTNREELKGNIAILLKEHKKRMKVVTNCFKTLSVGWLCRDLLLDQSKVFTSHSSKQYEQEQPRQADEQRDGREELLSTLT